MRPRSQARPDGFARVLTLLRQDCGDARLVLLARAVSTPDEQLRVLPLGQVQAEWVDMRTLVIVGSSLTRLVARDAGTPWLYTPRSVAAVAVPAAAVAAGSA